MDETNNREWEVSEADETNNGEREASEADETDKEKASEARDRKKRNEDKEVQRKTSVKEEESVYVPVSEKLQIQKAATLRVARGIPKAKETRKAKEESAPIPVYESPEVLTCVVGEENDVFEMKKKSR